MMKSTLIIGVDSVIGSVLRKKLLLSGWKVYGTTRDIGRVSEDVFFLDLANMTDFVFQEQVDVVFLCAGLTSFQDCRENPDYAQLVNVDNQVKLAQFFTQRNVHIIFLSSTAVFSGDKPFRKIYEPSCPVTVYGRCKADAEEALIGLGGCISIVRLTKVLTTDYLLIHQWLDRLKQGMHLTPFYDLSLSPISIQFVVYCLSVIADKQITGMIHLSGAEDVTYEFIARYLVKLWGLDFKLIHPQSAVIFGVLKAEAPLYTTLDMTDTVKLLGVHAIPIATTLNDLYKDIVCRA